MSDPGRGSLEDARRAAQAGAKPDHDPAVPGESPELLQQAVGRGGPAGPLESLEPGATSDPDDALDEEEDWDLEESEEPSVVGEDVPLAPVARLESLPAFPSLTAGLAEPLHLRSPERFLAAAGDPGVQPSGGSGRSSESATSLQPWAETGAPAGRNKRPLEELVAEYAARIAADPEARAGVPDGRHPADIYLDRFRSGGGGRNNVGGATTSGERRGDRAGRRGRRTRGAERAAGPQAGRLPAGDAQSGGEAPSQDRSPASAGQVAPGSSADPARAGRGGRRSSARRRGGARGGGEAHGGGQPGATSPAEQGRPRGGTGQPPRGGSAPATGSSASRRRGRGRGRGRGGRGGGQPGQPEGGSGGGGGGTGGPE